MEAEGVAYAAVAAIWISCRVLAASVSEQWGPSLHTLLHWYNNGNGSCLLHSWSHAVGYMPRSEGTLPTDQAQEMRDALAAAALIYIYQGRFRGRSAFDKANREERRLTGVALSIAQKRADFLGLEMEDTVPETRSTSWPERMVMCLDQRYRTPRVQLPTAAFFLIAELEGMNVVVLRRDDQARLQIGEYEDQPLAFAPQAGEASRTIAVLHCVGGEETAAARWGPWKDSNEVEHQRRVSGNHYVYMQSADTAEPLVQEHAPGSAQWKQRMRVGMDRVLNRARIGTPSEQRHQREVRPDPQQQQQPQQQDATLPQQRQQQDTRPPPQQPQQQPQQQRQP